MQEHTKLDLTLESLHETAKKMLLAEGFVAPILFLCSGTGTRILEIDFLEDTETKEHAIQVLTQEIVEHVVYKIFIVSEHWTYDIPEEMSDEEFLRKMQSDTYRQQLDKEEGFQVIEITRDNVNAITQAFKRDEETVTLLKENKKASETLVSFKPLQDALHPLG